MADPSSTKAKTDLFVRAIPYEATSEQLTDFFAEIAPVKHAVVVTDTATGMSKGFGFVSFAEADDAQNALEQTKKRKFLGKALSIEFAKPRTRRGEEKEEPKEDTKVERRRPRLIVRNLPWSVRDKSVLVKIFSKFGKVDDAFIPRQPGGKMSGFGFVTMRRKISAVKAVEESKDLKIDNRAVTVDFAVQKEKWLDGGKEKGDVESDEESEEDEDEESEVDDDNDAKDGEEDEDVDMEDDDEEDDEDEEEVAAPAYKQRPAPNSATIFVRNIPYDATKETLAEHFSKFGPVRYALPVMDKVLNQPKGTAFVAFYNEDHLNECVKSAPSGVNSSVLIADDVDPRYVFEGRILSVSRSVERETADKLASASARERQKVLGRDMSGKDRRNMFLMNEGRIVPGSKLAEKVSTKDMEIRQNSFDLRKEQLSKNPSLHLSLTRLAVRNLPRAMNDKALKALARKAVVEFATEVKEGKRQPLTKEEVIRSVKFQDQVGIKSKHGVVHQSKVIMENKESNAGRSRSYGFVEYRNHKAALMGLRWLNAHLVTKEEVYEGIDEDKREKVDVSDTKRRLVVEFAVENAQVVKRRRDQHYKDVAQQEKRQKIAEAVVEPEPVPEKAPEPEKNMSHIISRKRKQKAHRK